MADIKLGPSGDQTTLPPLCWPQGSEPDVPFEQDSGAEEARTIDGGVRVNLVATAPGTWTLTWDGLVWSDVSSIITASPLNTALVYTNQYTDNTNHTVYVQRRSYGLKAATAARTARYVVNLVLREIT
jgi:hypothetical protein